MSKIILATLNVRHLHSSLGLRYLLANMGELREKTAIREFTLEPWPTDIAEKLLAEQPQIIGIGVYIWNIEQSRRLVALLKVVSPETIIILGGPEVSHEWQNQEIVDQADYLITGQADLAFAQLCREILNGNPPEEKVIRPPLPGLSQLASPYPLYSDEDIAHRLIYVEASRGCPFKCEFCLSALDKSTLAFPLAPFLAEMKQLLARGVRHFKFVDRTFNLKPDLSCAILEFFLERMDEPLFLHFEVIPDQLPDRLKALLQRFPHGSLQLEVGVQTFNPVVQKRISRKQNNQATDENLRWLGEHTNAHIHADLIFGLPGEGISSIAESFDRMVALAPHEVQLGILKRLKGTPIIRYSDAYGMRYNPNPPYDILQSSCIDFATMQRLTRFTRYWEMIANSGRFKKSLPAILGESPFKRFMQLSDWLFRTTEQVHRIALKRLFELLYRGMTSELDITNETATGVLTKDFSHCAIKGRLPFLTPASSTVTAASEKKSHSDRQQRHG
ncbi:MAG: DUF4080 domain-containing protein [Candidatus Sedimenticola sp. (ex Thyasira tokunagai)]